MPSSVIRAFFYDAGRERLTIVFKSGRRYAYVGVPEAIYRGLLAAESKGRYFNENIRDRFPFESTGELR